jgi:hypothetical protein
MAIDTADKKWSIIRLGIGGPPLGGSPISLDDQWVFVGRYWGTQTLLSEIITQVFFSSRQFMRLMRQTP